MNHAITVELHFFLVSILWGAIILLAYDALRILRRLIRHNSFFLALEDLIFWVIASVFIFSMIFKLNNGTIRGFSVLGMGIGMILYHYIFSDMVVKIITGAIRLLFKPFTLFCRQLMKLLVPALAGIKRAINYPIVRLKKKMKSVKITLRQNRKKRKAARKRKKNIKNRNSSKNGNSKNSMNGKKSRET